MGILTFVIGALAIKLELASEQLLLSWSTFTWLGFGGYSALHIRRNDLQYSDDYQGASASYGKVHPMLVDRETLYIATDEKAAGFFNAFTEVGHRTVRWDDLVNGPLKGVRVPRKLVGCIEQAICAAGRRFFGTKHSTFSQYVFRLRGYYPASDSREYWHNYQYTGFAEVDSLAQPHNQGRSYFVENSIVWEQLE